MRKVQTLAVLATAAAALAAVPAGGAATQRSAAAMVTVKATVMEWMVTAKPASVKAGMVKFVVRNAGTQRHNFVVIKTKSTGMLPMKGAVAVETGRVGKTRVLAAGASQTLMLRLGKGTYQLICNVPGHYMAGMKKVFRVS